MRIVSLAGGVGASKLLYGMRRVMPAENLTVIVNTGDDFAWMGLYVCPDLDTVTYTLAGVSNPDTGWGIAGDTFRLLERLAELGADPWFRIGDRDAATHLFRTERLRQGARLSEVTREIAARYGIAASIVPMTDSPVPTRILVDSGEIAFQDYFVKRKCPPIRGVRFESIEHSSPPPGVLDQIRSADAVVVCPSNPLISIAPILAIPGVRRALQDTRGRVLAISPLIAGMAIKGPTAAMMSELGYELSACGVASLYRDFVDVFVIDQSDEALTERIQSMGLEVRTAPTVMDSSESKIRLARIVLEIIG